MTSAVPPPARLLGTWAATALVVSEVVGVGILLTPATMMRTLGGVWAPLLMWLAMGTLTAAGALCYAELATRYPRAGGAYVFLREGFGRRCAFVYGWMAMLVMDPGITAALGIGFAQYLLAALGLPSRFMPVLAISGIAGFAVLVNRGVTATGRAMAWSATLKLTIVGLLVGAGVWRGAGSGLAGHGTALTAPGLEGMAAVVVAAFFAFGGWWDLGRVSEDVATPRRTMPVALVGGVLLVTAIYVMVTLTFAVAAPAGAALTDEAFVAAAGEALFGRTAGRLLAVMVVITVSGSLVAVLFGAPRTYVAMMRDGLLPVRYRWLDPQRGSSPAGTTVQAVLASVLVLLGSFDQILGYFVPAAVFFLGLSAASLFVLPRPAGAAGAFTVPLYPLPLVVFLGLIAAMLLLFVLGQPTQTLLGAGVVLLGLAVSRFVI